MGFLENMIWCVSNLSRQRKNDDTSGIPIGLDYLTPDEFSKLLFIVSSILENNDFPSSIISDALSSFLNLVETADENRLDQICMRQNLIV